MAHGHRARREIVNGLTRARSPGLRPSSHKAGQIPFRRGRVEGDTDLIGELPEAQHLDLDRPRAVGQVGKGIPAILIRGGEQFLVAFTCRNCRAGDGESAGLDRAVVFRGHEAGGRNPDSQKPPEVSVDSIQCHEVLTGRRGRHPKCYRTGAPFHTQNKMELLNNKGQTSCENAHPQDSRRGPTASWPGYKDTCLQRVTAPHASAGRLFQLPLYQPTLKPSQRATTAAARQFPSTLTAVRAMSSTASKPSRMAKPSTGRWNVVSVPTRITSAARGTPATPLLVSIRVNIITNCSPAVMCTLAACATNIDAMER